MNLARYPVTLRQGMVLGELEPVEVVEKEPGEAVGPEINVESGIPVYVQTLLEGVDQSVPLEVRQRLTELLVEYAPVFSQDDGDLGRANAVKHRIDTGPPPTTPTGAETAAKRVPRCYRRTGRRDDGARTVGARLLRVGL